MNVVLCSCVGWGSLQAVTPEESLLKQEIKLIKENVEETIECLIAIPPYEKTPENTIRPWNQLHQDLSMQCRALTLLSFTDSPLKEEADLLLQDLMLFVSKSLFQNLEVSQALLGYAEHFIQQDGLHTPYEHYEIQSLLQQIKAFHPEHGDWVKRLEEQNSHFEKTPYLYLQGHGYAKEKRESLRVLSLDTHFVPAQFPEFEGELMLPWEERVSPIVEKIKLADADVVCLQQVQAEDASYALYNALKGEYHYFYVAIGPNVMGFSPKSLGISSGLFVASRYPLQNPRFTPFSITGLPSKDGFFDFVIVHELGPVHIYHTHLESVPVPYFGQVRAMQMNQILDTMQEDYWDHPQEIPFILCGNLSIPYGTKEPGLALIDAFFRDGLINRQEQSVDYALLLKMNPDGWDAEFCDQYQIDTEIISMEDATSSELSLSDHPALLSKISLTH